MCDNHRGITVWSYAGKIYTGILEMKLKDCVLDILDDFHLGLRPERSSTDAVLTVKMMLEKWWEWSIDKYAPVMDLQKVFERVKRSLVWRILLEDHYNVSAKLVRVIRSRHSPMC